MANRGQEQPSSPPGGDGIVSPLSRILVRCGSRPTILGAVRVVYEVRPRQDRRGFDLISEALPFGKLWHDDTDAAISYARFFSRSKDIEIRVYDEIGTLIETRKCQGEFVEP
jgi:hypothetical protein